ncbi:MAG TPA: hypothetical protein VK863_06780, partial [Candidatus Limnocylindrales bacterium]|nr:hypothetical protein [Candidatus Limnocylindrales bacterium]
MKRRSLLPVVILITVIAPLLLPGEAFAAGEDPSVPLLIYLVLILLAAKLMGHIGVLLGQPSVLGELC